MAKKSTNLFIKLIKKELGLDCIAEYRFHPVRKWRADYAILSHKILIEQEGGVFSFGRHTRGAGYLKDMEKYNNATALGFKILRFTPSQLLSKDTIELMKKTIDCK